jgi:HSP20 family protein
MREGSKKLRSLLLNWPRFGAHQHPWQPCADVYRQDQGWLAKFELAGVSRNDITVSVKQHRLTVRGIRRDDSVQHGNQSYSMEISYNEFMKTIEFPCDIENAQIDVEYRNGMLHVRLLTGGSDVDSE